MLLYIWVRYRDPDTDKLEDNWNPHTTFKRSDRDDADFEIQDLRDQGHRAKYGAAFK